MLGELRGELRHMATKADLAMLEARLTRWSAGVGLDSRLRGNDDFCKGAIEVVSWPPPPPEGR